MALVNYPDSASSDDESSTPIDTDLAQTNGHGTLKRKRHHDHDAHSILPPLPLSFHDLYASNSRTANQDDPALHAGRQRLTPHIEGNWPTHVYIEWYPSRAESDRLHELVAGIASGLSSECPPIHSLLKSDLGASLPLHISLCRPIVLLTHQRQAFNDALAHALGKSGIRPFATSVRGLDWVANEEKTRWFLVLRIEPTPKNELAQLLRITNRVVETFGQKPLYEELRLLPSFSNPQGQGRDAPGKSDKRAKLHPRSPAVESGHTIDLSSRFHISIGWSLSAPSANSSLTLKDRTGVHNDTYKFHISSVKVKIGNGVTAYSLPSRVETSNGIIGA